MDYNSLLVHWVSNERGVCPRRCDPISEFCLYHFKLCFCEAISGGLKMLEKFGKARNLVVEETVEACSAKQLVAAC